MSDREFLIRHYDDEGFFTVESYDREADAQLKALKATRIKNPNIDGKVWKLNQVQLAKFIVGYKTARTELIEASASATLE